MKAFVTFIRTLFNSSSASAGGRAPQQRSLLRVRWQGPARALFVLLAALLLGTGLSVLQACNGQPQPDVRASVQVSGQTAGQASDQASSRTSERAQDRASERASDRASGGVADWTRDRASERANDRNPDRASGRASDRASDRSSDRASRQGADGLGTVAVADLPAEARQTLALIREGGPYPYEKDGTVTNEVAESIETSDNQTLTVKLKDGWTFSDGTPVTADSFIKAWNYGALASNAQLSNYFYELIEGYSDEKDSELSGLKKVDDLTFTIKLTAPASDFKLRLGYSAFYPLPESAYEDMAAFGQKPIGNGPYTLTSWEHDSQIELAANPSYQGVRPAKNKGITFTIYTDYDSAYNDLLADTLDVLDAIPDSALSSFKDELGERAINQPGAVIQCFAIDVNTEHWKMDDEGRARRAALSRAIDRKQICDTLYYETRTPASDFTSPVIAGWKDKVTGNEVLQFDEAEAKSLWDKAEAISSY